MYSIRNRTMMMNAIMYNKCCMSVCVCYAGCRGPNHRSNDGGRLVKRDTFPPIVCSNGSSLSGSTSIFSINQNDCGSSRLLRITLEFTK